VSSTYIAPDSVQGIRDHCALSWAPKNPSLSVCAPTPEARQRVKRSQQRVKRSRWKMPAMPRCGISMGRLGAA
jgi:hypothetical protein